MPGFHPPVITALYAGLLGLVSIALALGAGKARADTGISIGDGGNLTVIVAMRRHANFVENVPLVLILLGVLELNGVSNAALHGIGGVLFVSRVLHPIGLRAENSTVLRSIGAIGTTLVTLVAAVWAVAVFFQAS